jgi:hypothetical protein
VTNYLRKPNEGRKGLIWLKVSEASVHGQLASLFGACGEAKSWLSRAAHLRATRKQREQRGRVLGQNTVLQNIPQRCPSTNYHPQSFYSFPITIKL